MPLVTLFYYGFTSWNAFGRARWVGFDNYSRLLGDASFWVAVRNTAYYGVLYVPLTLALSLGLALLLNQKIRGLPFFRTAAFFPYITSIVAIAVVWNTLFSPDFGRSTSSCARSASPTRRGGRHPRRGRCPR